MLRASYEHVAADRDASWKCFRRAESRFEFDWHYHPEFELTLVTDGGGSRFVGDSVEDYRPGDLVLLGPDLPHTYVSTGDRAQAAIVAQFPGGLLGGDGLRLPEFAGMARLLARASRGLAFPTGHPDTARTATPLRDLDRMPPAERTIVLLTALHRLSGHPAARPLASAHAPRADQETGRRIGAVIRLLHEEYSRPIPLSEIAAVAHLSEAATSRFFRRTTGSTLTDYLNGLRVNAACRLLVESDRPIAEIAAEAGFQNLSHFNRRFLAGKGMSPRRYRARFATAEPGPGSGPGSGSGSGSGQIVKTSDHAPIDVENRP